MYVTSNGNISALEWIMDVVRVLERFSFLDFRNPLGGKVCSLDTTYLFSDCDSTSIYRAAGIVLKNN